MPHIHGILYDKDKRVRLYNQGVPVVNSNLQSAYSKYLNLIGDRFTSVLNGDKYDVGLKYADKLIPYEGGVAQGTVPGYLDFNDTHFDVSALTVDKYVVTNPAYGEAIVNSSTAPSAFSTPHKLNFIGATVAEDVPGDKFDITTQDVKTAVFNNDVQVGTVARRPNFLGTGHSIVEDTTNDQFDIDLAYLPNPLNKQYGLYRWSGAQEAKEGIFSGIDLNTSGGGTLDVGDDADGLYVDWYTDDKDGSGEDNNYVELTTGNDFITRRDYNPHFYGKIKIMTSGFRFFAGFHDNNPLTEDDNVYLANNSGIGFSYSTDVPDTNYQIRRNDGDATEDKTSTAVAFAAGTLVSFHIWGNSAGWFWSINNGAASAAITTEVPAAATRMYFTTRLEEIGGTEQNMKIYHLYYLSDK